MDQMFGPDAVAALADPALDPLFWRPSRLGVESAWYGHIPFAHWVIRATRPGCLVELGSHAGVSYAAFCDAVLRERLATRCFAVDTWQGDEHAGFYGEQVYQDFATFHDRHYAGFSRLLRGTFDAALPYIADGSVDLLHVDGRHHYDDVRHDFESWIPKLSPRAVVLFHDTNVRERDFGVWRLWAERRETRPSFEFLHAHGLGVLAYGEQVPPMIAALIASADAAAIRERFALLGERWEQDFQRTETANHAARAVARAGQLQQESEKLRSAMQAAETKLLVQQRHAGEAREHVRSAREAQATLAQALEQAQARLAERDSQAVRLEADRARLAADRAGLAADRTRLETEKEVLARDVDQKGQQIATLAAEKQIILNSTLWRVTKRLQGVAALVPGPLRARLKGVPPRSRPAATPMSAPPPERSAAVATPASKPRRPAPVPAADTAMPAARPGPPRVVFVSGEAHTPGHDYRVLRPAQAARRLGWRADIVDIAGEVPKLPADIAVLVVWRAPWTEKLGRLLQEARGLGAATIYDVDDLMFRPDLATIELIDGIRSQRLTEAQVADFYTTIHNAMAACEMASATTTELASQLRGFGKPALVSPNCWDLATWQASRLAVRERAATPPDGLLRIGYAGGTRTHQKDFALCAGAVAHLLRARPQARLVLFRDPSSGEGVVVASEFAPLAGLEAQIEWRDMVKLADLPAEMARFDINLAPLEIGNPFCEAKSELKYFEAALVGVPTIASPTGPFGRAISPATGRLAADDAGWLAALQELAEDAALRHRLADAALDDATRRFGPLRQEQAVGALLDHALGGRPAAHALLRDIAPAPAPAEAPPLPAADTLFVADRLGRAEVTVVVPLYNYEGYVLEALETVAAQTLEALDLVIVEDRSTDRSLAVALDWARANAARFNRIVVRQHRQNAGLGFGRNTGFAAAQTPYVLPLDADNRLRPECCERLAAALRATAAAFVHPQIQRFGGDDRVIGRQRFLPVRFKGGNTIDAMALIRRDAWLAVGGYDHVKFGWEDYDFWCRLAEMGLWGERVPETLAEYRVHDASMLHTQTDLQANKVSLIANMKKRHTWLDETVMRI